MLLTSTWIITQMQINPIGVEMIGCLHYVVSGKHFGRCICALGLFSGGFVLNLVLVLWQTLQGRRTNRALTNNTKVHSGTKIQIWSRSLIKRFRHKNSNFVCFQFNEAEKVWACLFLQHNLMLGQCSTVQFLRFMTTDFFYCEKKLFRHF